MAASKRTWLLTLAVLSACAGPIPLSENDPFIGRALPFDIHQGFIYAVLEGINGERLKLVLDTGAHSTILTRDALQACTTLKYLRSNTVRMSTREVRGSEYLVSGLVWGGIPLGTLEAFVVERDDHPFLLETHLDGLLGFPVLSARAMKINYRDRTVTFVRPDEELQFKGVVPFEWEGQGSHGIKVVAHIGDHPFSFQVDTGLGITKISRKTAEKAQLPLNPSPAAGAGPPADKILVPSLRVGNLEARQDRVWIRQPVTAGDGVIGNYFLMHFQEVIFDFKGQHLRSKFRSSEESEQDGIARASSGDGEAAFWLYGLLYQRGGDEPSPEALAWLAKAAELGSIPAQ